MKKFLYFLLFWLFLSSSEYVNAAGTFSCTSNVSCACCTTNITCQAGSELPILPDGTLCENHGVSNACPVGNYNCISSSQIPSSPSNGTGTNTSSVVNLNTLLSSMNGFKFAGANSNLGAIISALLPYFYAFAGVGLLLLLIWGGFKYMTSAGDPKKTEGAKGTITAAVIGFFIVIAAYWLTQIVNYIFGLGVQVP